MFYYYKYNNTLFMSIFKLENLGTLLYWDMGQASQIGIQPGFKWKD